MIRKLLCAAFVFAVGGLGYAAIELLWRGRTHPSMVAAGGLCMCIMFAMVRRFRTMGVFARAVTSAVIITIVEFILGCFINNWLRLGIWDYSDRKWNVMGQICPLYTVLWGVLSIPASQLCILINKLYENVESRSDKVAVWKL